MLHLSKCYKYFYIIIMDLTLFVTKKRYTEFGHFFSKPEKSVSAITEYVGNCNLQLPGIKDKLF